MELDTLLNESPLQQTIKYIFLDCVISLNLVFYITQGYKIYELVYNVGSVHNISGFQVIISFYNACINSAYYMLKETSDPLFSFSSISTAMIPTFYSLIFLFHFSKRVVKVYILYLLLLFGSIGLLCFGIIKCNTVFGDGFMNYLNVIAIITNCLYFFQSINLKANFSVFHAHRINIVNAIFGLVHSIGWIIYFILQQQLGEENEKRILIIYSFGSVVSSLYIIQYIRAKTRKETIVGKVIYHEELSSDHSFYDE